MQTYEQVMYFVDDKVRILKLVGTLRFKSAPYLEKALSYLKEYSQEIPVIIDLTETEYMDSTVMGTMAKLFLHEQLKSETSARYATIVFKDEDVKKIFSTMGLNSFFNFQKTDPRINIPAQNFMKCEALLEDRQSLKESISSAHQTLSKFNAHNEDFERVVQLLKDK